MNASPRRRDGRSGRSMPSRREPIGLFRLGSRPRASIVRRRVLRNLVGSLHKHRPNEEEA
jgi:hypothetical protein